MATIGLISNLLTDEQRKKVDLVEERLDSRGIFTRFRVEDQTVFDAFLLMDLIDRHEHDGLICFLKDVERSGGAPASCNLEPQGSGTASYKVGDRTSARWLSFSYVYRHLDRKGVREEADLILRLIPGMYSWRDRWDRDGLKKMCAGIRPAISTIAKFYGCSPKPDPRMVILSGKYSE